MSSKLPDTLPLVLIRWRDITPHDDNWVSLDDALAWAESNPGTCTTTAFLLKKTRKYILIAGAIGAKSLTEGSIEPDKALGTVECIPRGCIDDIKVIRQVKR